MTLVLKELLKNTYTDNDLHRRLRLLQECLEKLHYEEPQQMRVLPQQKQIKKIVEEIVPKDDQSTILALSEEVWNHFTPATVATKMTDLLSESDTLPKMILYIPVAFTDTQLAPLSEWARAEVEPGLLFEIHVDPKVVGGCAFVYKDNHFDWSLRRYLRAKRGMVTSLLNAYGE